MRVFAEMWCPLLPMPSAVLSLASDAASAPRAYAAAAAAAGWGPDATDEGAERPRKKPRLGDPKGDWICKACWNANFADLAVCNMRKCGALRGAPRQDWQCIACGNVNFADRMFCNMRKCGAARLLAGVLSDEKVVIPRPQQSSVQPGEGLPLAGLSAPSSGGCATAGPLKPWPGDFAKAGGICVAMPAQSPVQLQKLAHTRQPLAPLPTYPPQQVRETQQMLQQDALEIVPPTRNAVPGQGRTSAEMRAQIPERVRLTLHSCGKGVPTDPKRGAKKGDWRCSCWHLNFKHSAFCKNCELARVLDRWLCSECSNMNFADTAFCNMRTCMSPRKDVEPMVLNELFCKGLGKQRRR